MNDLEIFAARLLKVEGQLRHIKRMAVMGCILAVIAMTIGQAFPQTFFGLEQLDPLGTLPRPEAEETSVQPVLRASHFMLVDENGKERASLVPDDDGSVYLVMFDRDGKSRINLSLTGSGPSLSLYDSSGQARAVVGSTALVGSRIAGERTPPSTIVLFDKDGKLLSRQ